MIKIPFDLDPPRPAGVAGVYIVSVSLLAAQPGNWRIDGRPVRAWAPHPDHDDLMYVTVEHPETLAFLPVPYVERD